MQRGHTYQRMPLMYLKDDKIKLARWWAFAVLVAIATVGAGDTYEYTQDGSNYYERHPEKAAEMLKAAESLA